MSGLSQCLTMDPTDPNNHLWLYNWVLINWIPQIEQPKWNYERYMQTYRNHWGQGNVEDVTPHFTSEKNHLSLATIQVFREGTVTKIEGGYGFRRFLPGTGNMVFTIFVADNDPRLTSIRKMRNIDRINKVDEKPERDIESIARECGLRS